MTFNLQINLRFYLAFIRRPWRRHEFEASLMALLKTVLGGTPNASFHACFTCCNCTHPWFADGYAVDGPDPGAGNRHHEDGSPAKSAGHRIEDGAGSHSRTARHQLGDRRTARRSA